MRAEGVVTALEGGTATVVVLQRPACSGCGESCADCRKPVKHEIRVENAGSFRVGERVWVESPTRVIALAAALVFLMPAAVAGAFGVLLWNSMSEAAASIATFAVLCLSFAFAYLFIGRRLLKSNKYRLMRKL